MELTDVLLALYQRNAEAVSDLAWASEEDRWAEFAFCVLAQCGGESAESVRQGVVILGQLGLLSPKQLKTLEAGTPGHAVFTHVLTRVGFSEDEAVHSAKVLAAIGSTVDARYAGKIQRRVRSHAEVLRDALVAELANSELPDDQLRLAVSLWLQNAFNLPLSLQDDVVGAFCEANDLTMEKLMEAIDELDLNAALLDDVLAAEAESSEAEK